MAAASTLPASKRRKQVYGKLVSRSNWDVSSFFDEDELASSAPRPLARPTGAKEVVAPSIKNSNESAAAAKHTMPRARIHDPFDIRSSDDELLPSARARSPPRFHKKNALIDDTDSSVAQLAPWEEKKSQKMANKAPKKDGRSSSASPEAQLQQDPMRAVSSPKGRTSTLPSSPNNSTTGSAAAGEASSAMARLAARRQETSLVPPLKRLALASDETQNTPRKRTKASSDHRIETQQRDMYREESPVIPAFGMSEKPSNARIAMDDVYGFPTSSEDELATRKVRPQEQKHAKRTSNRGKPTTYTSRSIMLKGVSAPARLSEMLTDTDTTEAPTRSPSTSSRKSTPQKLPSTPPTRNEGSPETAIKAVAAMTPKQAQLWHDLLPSDGAAASPSTLPIKDLAISGKRGAGASTVERKLTKSRSDRPRRQTRLVDRLKASAGPSEDVLIDDENEVAMEIEESSRSVPGFASFPERPHLTKRVSSQTQSQLATMTNSGPKITYSSGRSYLQEDNLAHDLMGGLVTESPQHRAQAKRTARSAPNSQKSTFDLDDSDDDAAGGGKIRTIHELRAAGRTVSGMYDVEELLGEIQDHNAAHKGRRRGALIRLATKLTDKAFAIRFTGQSFEIELAAECKAASDEIADFVLAAALGLVLVSEPPKHSVWSLKDQGTVAWLVRLLDRHDGVDRMAKDRRNNMSKSAQRTLIDFGERLEKQSSLWGEVTFLSLTPRLLSLKVLDRLVSKIRHFGDRSKLLQQDRMTLLLPNESTPPDVDKQYEMVLSVSILESLSTTSASMSWPSNILDAIAELLPALETTLAAQRHTLFLTMRLCLNLTNDNPQNCARLSASRAVVQCLLRAVCQGFQDLACEPEGEKHALALDFLVLALGIMINLAENSDTSRLHSLHDPGLLSSLITTFQNGQKHILEAESVQESVSNVAFGYLAVMLSNVCQNEEAGRFVAERLPGKNLGMLIEAVEEFVVHHQRVDTMNFEGDEGAEVWEAFTEKLKVVLARLKGVAETRV